MLERILSVKTRSWAWFKERADGPHALFWLAVLAFLEPTFSPIIPETLMVAMILARPTRWAYFAAIAAAASIAGGVAGYLIGAALFAGVGDLIIGFYHLEPWMERARLLFSENVFTTMAVVTFTPVPDKIFVFLAGFLHISFPIYIGGYIVGRTARIFLVGWLLKRFGAHVLALADKYAAYVGVVVMVALVIVILDAFGVIGLPTVPW